MVLTAAEWDAEFEKTVDDLCACGHGRLAHLNSRDKHGPCDQCDCKEFVPAEVKKKAASK